MLHFPYAEHHERLVDLNLLPLVYRMEYLDICFFYKCLYNFYDVNIRNLIYFTPKSVDPLRLCIPNTSTLQYQKFNFNIIVYLWKSLPPRVWLIHDLGVFKNSSCKILIVYFVAIVTKQILTLHMSQIQIIGFYFLCRGDYILLYFTLLLNLFY